MKLATHFAYITALSGMLLTGALSTHAAAQNAQNAEETEGPVFLPQNEEIQKDDLKDAAATVSVGGRASLIYNDNIYRSELVDESDFIAQLRPAFRLKTDLKPYELRVDGNVEMGHYLSDDNNDYVDTDLRALLSYDASQYTNIYTDGRFRYDHVAIGAFVDDPDVLAEDPTTYRYSEAGLGIVSDMPKWYAAFDSRIEYYNYDNVDRVNNTRFINDDRDFFTSKGTGRLGYKFVPKSVVYVQAGVNSRNYDEQIDSTLNQPRDSDGYELLLGTSYGDKKESLWFDAAAGYVAQNYASAVLDDVDAVAFRGEMQWRPSDLTRVRAEVTRDVRETTLIDTSAFIQDRFRLRGETAIAPSWILGGGIRYTQNDFQVNPINGRTDREDDIWDGSIYLDYMLTEDYAIGLEYAHVDPSSNESRVEFDSNVLLMRFGVEY